jgi:two-component system sensor histidine kinase UhpB
MERSSDIRVAPRPPTRPRDAATHGAPPGAAAAHGVPPRDATGPGAPPGRSFIGLFWRLFIPNAAVLCAASVVLIVAPPNGRVLVVLGGLAGMLATNVVLMRHAFAPLERLTALMARVDPLRPGERAPQVEPASEVSTLAETFNDMLDRLERERRESGRRAMLAEEAERRRVASDLHDEVGQSLTALVLRLKHAASQGKLRGAELEALVDVAEGILADVRSVARRLRPEALDDLGLRSALLALRTRLERASNVSLSVLIAGDVPELSPEVELVIYRVAQESLTNVLRHAEARTATVELTRDDGLAVLVVGDDGRGFDPGAGGAGLRGMRERALLIGGALEIESRSGGGTRVRLAVPLSPMP